MMMNKMLLVLCTVAAGALMLDAAYLQPNVVDASAKDSETAQRSQQQVSSNDIRAYYMERYSPEVARILLNPHLMEELLEAVQQQQQLESEYKPAVPSKRAQTFVRFGKRAQTFVRFG